MSDSNADYSDFKLTFEIAIIEHLGLNLYSEVHSAISELLANAYDAEATSVKIQIPLGVSLGLSGQKIIIEDDGHGMTYEECRDKFLKIGRNRRAESKRSKSGIRTVIGKKGIGKLAGFGIANQVRVSTVANYKKTEFLLNLDDIRQAEPKELIPSSANEVSPKPALNDPGLVREYRPKLIMAEKPVKQERGTVVTLENIRPLDPINLEDFVDRLRRKFAIFGDAFNVKILLPGADKDIEITKFDVPTQFRFPDSGWAADAIYTPTMGEQQIRYWIGFTRSTIKQDALRGISVLSNGKSVQEPFDFKMSGGTEGQFGLQYMTGEVMADWLDDQAIDLIASDRSSVRWSDPDATKLLDWGRTKIKILLKEWVKLRASKTIEEINISEPKIKKEIESYQGEARQELEHVVDRVVTTIAHIGQERTSEVVMSIVNAYRHDHIRTVLNKIIDGQGGLDLFVEALHQWDLIDAVLTFQELSVKLSAIQTFKALIVGKATEVKTKSNDLSLHEHLAAHPWLIDPMFSEMEHERNIDKYILEKYNLDPKPNNPIKRFDFILLYNSERIRIVEIKSAKDPVDARGVLNLIHYHSRIAEQEGKRGNSRAIKTLLIHNGEPTDEARNMLDSLNDDYEVFTWQEILDRNETIYKEQLKYVREKNPSDPRVISLWNTMQERVGATLELAHGEQEK